MRQSTDITTTNAEARFRWRGAAIDIPDSDPTPEEMFGQEEDYEELLRAIRSLDPIYRDILLLKYLYEYDNGTIAAMTGIAEATVRVRLMRAKEKLSELLRGGESDGAK